MMGSGEGSSNEKEKQCSRGVSGCCVIASWILASRIGGGDGAICS